MKFWDSSAVVPLCCTQPSSPELHELFQQDDDIVVWWATPVECSSAIRRLEREAVFSPTEAELALAAIALLAQGWSEVLATSSVRDEAVRILGKYPLRAADALQLAAAQVLAAGDSGRFEFVTLDQRLRSTAVSEGFAVVP